MTRSEEFGSRLRIILDNAETSDKIFNDETKPSQLFLQSQLNDSSGTEKIGTISGNNNVGNAIIGIARRVKTKIKNDSLNKYQQTRNEIGKERKAILDDLMDSDIPDSEKVKIYNIISKRG